MPDLPAGFEDLEPFIQWAEPTEAGRNSRRFSTSYDELKAFYDVMIKRTDAALTHLNEYPLDELDGQQKNLLYMCLSLTEVAFAVENYQQPDPPYLFPIERFVPEHDRWTDLYKR
ncbi:MAG: hypothetical protein AAF221_00540 [Pseudomonadota bacterium]